jgi:hypothetical protein
MMEDVVHKIVKGCSSYLIDNFIKLSKFLMLKPSHDKTHM